MPHIEVLGPWSESEHFRIAITTCDVMPRVMKSNVVHVLGFFPTYACWKLIFKFNVKVRTNEIVSLGAKAKCIVNLSGFH